MNANSVNMKVIVLVSGGMDSMAALYHACTEHAVVDTLSFDYGSKHSHCELPFACFHADGLGLAHSVCPPEFISDSFQSAVLPSGGEVPDSNYGEANIKGAVVPFRNGTILGGFRANLNSAPSKR